MKNRLIPCVLACLMIFLVGCNGNTAKEAAQEITKTETSFPAGTWVSSVVTDLMDAVSGMFLQALGTDMTAMEENFHFVNKAFTVMQYTAWAILFLITVWQLFRIFGGPVTDAENPWSLIGRSALFALLIGYAKPIFSMCLDIATAPYTALMDIQMTAEDFTFAGVEAMLMNGLTSLIATISVVGLLLRVILEIALGWNYFKLLLEKVERYIVVGVLCYRCYQTHVRRLHLQRDRRADWCHRQTSRCNGI